MKVFQRANLPDHIKYNGDVYVLDPKMTSRRLPKDRKFIYVDVLATNLRGKCDIHHKPYTPDRHVFSTDIWNDRQLLLCAFGTPNAQQVFNGRIYAKRIRI